MNKVLLGANLSGAHISTPPSRPIVSLPIIPTALQQVAGYLSPWCWMCWSCGGEASCLNQAWARSFLQHIVTQSKCLSCFVCCCPALSPGTAKFTILCNVLIYSTTADCTSWSLLLHMQLMEHTAKLPCSPSYYCLILSLPLSYHCWFYTTWPSYFMHAADIAYCDTVLTYITEKLVSQRHIRQTMLYFVFSCAESSGKHQGLSTGVIWLQLYHGRQYEQTVLTQLIFWVVQR